MWGSHFTSYQSGNLNKCYRNARSNESFVPIKESANEYGIFDSQVDEN